MLVKYGFEILVLFHLKDELSSCISVTDICCTKVQCYNIHADMNVFDP